MEELSSLVFSVLVQLGIDKRMMTGLSPSAFAA